MRIAVFILGVIIPIAALLVESNSRLCGGDFVDPIPSIYHIYIVAFVAAANAIALFCSLNQTSHAGTLSLVRACVCFAVGVCLFYCLAMWPMFIFAFFLLLCVVGIPFAPLALSPLLAFIGSRKAFKMLDQNPGAQKGRFNWFAFAAGFLAVIILELPSSATRLGMIMALEPEKSKAGLNILRAFHDKDTMLRCCYERSSPTDLVGNVLTIGKYVSGEDARKIFYRATGVPFNSVSIPRTFHSRVFFDDEGMGNSRWTADDFDYDRDVAGASIGGVVRGVSLYKSEMNTTVDTKAAAAKTDWLMEFRNVSKVTHEARGQLQLPPGAVVSQVMLNVNGKWQQAAVAGRAATRKAYQAVVRRMCDPLLVTTSGPDRVMFQCFPVNPGKSMEIKLTITTPLMVDSSSAKLLLPEIIEHNFELKNHTVNIRANSAIANAQSLKTIQSRTPANNKPDALPFAYKTTIEGTGLNGDAITPIFQTNPQRTDAWSTAVGNKAAFHETIEELPAAAAPKKLLIVVDGSLALANKMDELKKALTGLPANTRVTLMRSGDSVEIVASDLSPDAPAWKAALEDLGQRTYIGGQDAVPALLQAIGQVKDNTALLWIHAAQPIELSNSKDLRQALVGKRSQVTLYDFAVAPGPNKVLEAMDGLPNVKAVPRPHANFGDLTELFKSWDGNAKTYKLAIKSEPSAQMTKGAYQSAVNLAPLWARGEIDRLLAAQDSGTETVAAAADKEQISAPMKKAVAVCSAYRIVSRVSGAVVLERKSDYTDNGLEAPTNKAEEVPVRPEPETWLLLLVAALFVIFAFKRRTTQGALPSGGRQAL